MKKQKTFLSASELLRKQKSKQRGDRIFNIFVLLGLIWVTIWMIDDKNLVAQLDRFGGIVWLLLAIVGGFIGISWMIIDVFKKLKYPIIRFDDEDVILHKDDGLIKIYPNAFISNTGGFDYQFGEKPDETKWIHFPDGNDNDYAYIPRCGGVFIKSGGTLKIYFKYPEENDCQQHLVATLTKDSK